jgi:hypothetical protein
MIGGQCFEAKRLVNGCQQRHRQPTARNSLPLSSVTLHFSGTLGALRTSHHNVTVALKSLASNVHLSAKQVVSSSLRHNEIRDELNNLAAKAFSPPRFVTKQSRRNPKLKKDEVTKDTPAHRPLQRRPWQRSDLRALGPRS